MNAELQKITNQIQSQINTMQDCELEIKMSISNGSIKTVRTVKTVDLPEIKEAPFQPFKAYDQDEVPKECKADYKPFSMTD